MNEHNEPASGLDALTAAAQDRLRTLVERIERIDEDLRSMREDLGAVYGEAKSEGFDTKILRRVIRLRKQDKMRREEEETLVEMYLAAAGSL